VESGFQSYGELRRDSFPDCNRESSGEGVTRRENKKGEKLSRTRNRLFPHAGRSVSEGKRAKKVGGKDSKGRAKRERGVFKLVLRKAQLNTVKQGSGRKKSKVTMSRLGGVLQGSAPGVHT